MAEWQKPTDTAEVFSNKTVVYLWSRAEETFDRHCSEVHRDTCPQGDVNCNMLRQKSYRLCEE